MANRPFFCSPGRCLVSTRNAQLSLVNFFRLIWTFWTAKRNRRGQKWAARPIFKLWKTHARRNSRHAGWGFVGIHRQSTRCRSNCHGFLGWSMLQSQSPLLWCPQLVCIWGSCAQMRKRLLLTRSFTTFFEHFKTKHFYRGGWARTRPFERDLSCRRSDLRTGERERERRLRVGIFVLGGWNCLIDWVKNVGKCDGSSLK